MIRVLDIVFSSIAVVTLLPVLIPVALVLRFTGEGEIFFVQQRVGLHQTKFGLLKFATMLKNSPNMGAGSITVRDDPRVLPVGKILRKTKINELPQLFNILMGDMSVIGPRPLTLNHFSMYSEAARKTISSVKPGLSGVGSIVFRDEERLISKSEDPSHYYATEVAPYKAALEVWFVENQGVWLYHKCILATLWVVLWPSSSAAKSLFKGLPKPEGELRGELYSES